MQLVQLYRQTVAMRAAHVDFLIRICCIACLYIYAVLQPVQGCSDAAWTMPVLRVLWHASRCMRCGPAGAKVDYHHQVTHQKVGIMVTMLRTTHVSAVSQSRFPWCALPEAFLHRHQPCCWELRAVQLVVVFQGGFSLLLTVCLHACSSVLARLC